MILTLIKTYRTWIIGALVALLLVVGYNQISSLISQKQSLKDAITYQQKEATVWRDKYNQSHAQNTVLQLDKATLKAQYEAELKKDFGVKAKDVTSITKVTTSTKGSLVLPIRPDSTFSSKTRWVDIEGGLQKGALHFTYEIKDSLSFITGYQRKFFKRDVYFVEVVSHNPFTTVKSLERIELKEKVKRFSLGVGVFYTPRGFQPGFGLQYNLLRF